MNTVAVIVITALVNFLVTGLVGGIIVYRFQKDIEANYNKQMEEFKANLQKISFEKQVKFEKLHIRRIEAVELLIKKYIVFSEALKELIMERKISLDKAHDVQNILTDFWESFRDNRHLIPDELIEDIENIYIYSRGIPDIAFLMTSNISLFENPSFISHVTETYDLAENWFIANDSQASLVTFVVIVRRHIKALEGIYKKITETT